MTKEACGRLIFRQRKKISSSSSTGSCSSGDVYLTVTDLGVGVLVEWRGVFAGGWEPEIGEGGRLPWVCGFSKESSECLDPVNLFPRILIGVINDMADDQILVAE